MGLFYFSFSHFTSSEFIRSDASISVPIKRRLASRYAFFSTRTDIWRNRGSLFLPRLPPADGAAAGLAAASALISPVFFMPLPPYVYASVRHDESTDARSLCPTPVSCGGRGALVIDV